LHACACGGLYASRGGHDGAVVAPCPKGEWQRRRLDHEVQCPLGVEAYSRECGSLRCTTRQGRGGTRKRRLQRWRGEVGAGARARGRPHEQIAGRGGAGVGVGGGVRREYWVAYGRGRQAY
jgi:hypothetical protein